MRRGEVWWANLPAPTGRRPVLLVSRDEAFTVRDLVMIAPVTTRIREIPAEVPLGQADGLPRICVANLDTLQTVPKAALERRIAALTAKKVTKVDEALRFALGL